MKLESKYNIGDLVYSANATVNEIHEICTDCNGSGKWDVTTPAGEAVVLFCPTCSVGWESGSGKSRKWVARPDVRQLTIGQVRYESDWDGGAHAMVFKYMCKETGVGSGTVYREDRLYRTREEADEVAQLLAVRLQEERDDQRHKQREREIVEAAKRCKCPMCGGYNRPKPQEMLEKAQAIVADLTKRKASRQKPNTEVKHEA